MILDRLVLNLKNQTYFSLWIYRISLLFSVIKIKSFQERWMYRYRALLNVYKQIVKYLYKQTDTHIHIHINLDKQNTYTL